jgi:hypothetical protein
MTDTEKHELVTSWIALQRVGADSSVRDESFWAYAVEYFLRKRAPDECLELIHAIRQADGSDEIL